MQKKNFYLFKLNSKVNQDKWDIGFLIRFLIRRIDNLSSIIIELFYYNLYNRILF